MDSRLMVDAPTSNSRPMRAFVSSSWSRYANTVSVAPATARHSATLKIATDRRVESNLETGRVAFMGWYAENCRADWPGISSVGIWQCSGVTSKSGLHLFLKD